MKRYRRVVTALPSGPGAAGAVAWTALVARWAGAEGIVFLAPAAGGDDLLRLLHPEDPAAETPAPADAARATVEAGWPADLTSPWSLVAPAGPVLEAALRTAREQSADLVVTVAGDGGEDDDGLAVRLARKAPCSVLAVPPGRAARLESVLVGADFSKAAASALEVALALATAAGVPEVAVLHVAELPRRAGRPFLPRGEVEREFLDYAAARLDDFVAAAKPARPTRREVVAHARPAAGLRRFARAGDFDLLVLGSKGKDGLTATLLGSTVEDLLRGAAQPVLVVKEKGATLGLLQVLLGP